MDLAVSNIGEQLIEKGLATALRHKKDDENRSPDYDKFIIAEKASVLSRVMCWTNFSLFLQCFR